MICLAKRRLTDLWRIDGAGNVAATVSYDACGNLTSATGTVTTPFGYAGQYTDAESGLQYLRNRYYDPSTEQFLTVDPLQALTQQPYGYASDSPVNWDDPEGLTSAGVCVSGLGGWAYGTYNSACLQVVTGGNVVSDVVGTLECLGGLLSSCLTELGRVETLGATWTTGGGAQTPAAGASLGVQVTNATSLCDLGGWFAYGGGSAFEPVTVGVGGFGGLAGRILGGELDLGGGADFPVPGELHGGMSYTWTETIWTRHRPGNRRPHE